MPPKPAEGGNSRCGSLPHSAWTGTSQRDSPRQFQHRACRSLTQQLTPSNLLSQSQALAVENDELSKDVHLLTGDAKRWQRQADESKRKVELLERALTTERNRTKEQEKMYKALTRANRNNQLITDMEMMRRMKEIQARDKETSQAHAAVMLEEKKNRNFYEANFWRSQMQLRELELKVDKEKLELQEAAELAAEASRAAHQEMRDMETRHRREISFFEAQKEEAGWLGLQLVDQREALKKRVEELEREVEQLKQAGRLCTVTEYLAELDSYGNASMGRGV